MSLRLVRPPEEGQATRPRKGRRSAALTLTVEEVRHLRAATRNAVRAYGNASALAAASGVPVATLHNVTSAKGRRPSAAVALRIARAAGMDLETLLGHRGALTEAGRCTSCGSRIGTERKAAS